jgi:LacI family transcriptional regulator
MGALGVELLAGMIAGQSTATETVTVDCPLLERASV